jgi:hypothetical protein
MFMTLAVAGISLKLTRTLWPAPIHKEVWNYESNRQLVGILGRVVRPLPAQDNTNTGRIHTDVHASVEM